MVHVPGGVLLVIFLTGLAVGILICEYGNRKK